MTISPARRYLLVDAPQVIVRQLGGSGHLESGDAHPLRVDPLEYPADHAVFAAGVHALQHDQQLVLALGKEQLLQRFQLGVDLLHARQRRLFVAFPGGGFSRVPLGQVDGLVWFDQVALPIDICHMLFLSFESLHHRENIAILTRKA